MSKKYLLTYKDGGNEAINNDYFNETGITRVDKTAVTSRERFKTQELPPSVYRKEEEG